MARLPVISRLHWREYLALVLSLLLVVLEAIVRILTLLLPSPIIRIFYNGSRSLFNYLSSSKGRRARAHKKTVVDKIAEASDFVDLCRLYGYYAEEHVVQTGDGYLLGLHRLGWKKGEEDERVNSGPGSVQKKVVYLHHGLLMNSEVWACITEEHRNLPFQLVERGYDVWLGNNRGNKYSKKSTKHSPNSNEFWDFSMDDFAFHDIPDSIAYILETTYQPSLSYIGFSQGTAQAFATLSIHPTLNDKVDVFIALAPAMSPAGLYSSIVDALVKASPQVLFLFFGRRSILSSATMWQQILYRPIFTRLIDMSLSFLFNWSNKNMSTHQKLAAYPHLYSFTSTKSVVHWFQIMRTKSFQMYDDEVQRPLGGADRYYKVAKFPTRNIKTPIVLVYGGSDSLVDIKVMLRELPRHTRAIEIKHFEHLDFLWADQVDKLVFPHVFSALDDYAGKGRLSNVSHLLPRGSLAGSVNGDSSSDTYYATAAMGTIKSAAQHKDERIRSWQEANEADAVNETLPPSRPQNLAIESDPRSDHTHTSSPERRAQVSMKASNDSLRAALGKVHRNGDGIKLGAAHAVVGSSNRPASAGTESLKSHKRRSVT